MEGGPRSALAQARQWGPSTPPSSTQSSVLSAHSKPMTWQDVKGRTQGQGGTGRDREGQRGTERDRAHPKPCLTPLASSRSSSVGRNWNKCLGSASLKRPAGLRSSFSSSSPCCLSLTVLLTGIKYSTCTNPTCLEGFGAARTPGLPSARKLSPQAEQQRVP